MLPRQAAHSRGSGQDNKNLPVVCIYEIPLYLRATFHFFQCPLKIWIALPMSLFVCHVIKL
jgi:hypothetical protein